MPRGKVSNCKICGRKLTAARLAKVWKHGYKCNVCRKAGRHIRTTIPMSKTLAAAICKELIARAEQANEWRRLIRENIEVWDKPRLPYGHAAEWVIKKEDVYKLLNVVPNAWRQARRANRLIQQAGIRSGIDYQDPLFQGCRFQCLTAGQQLTANL